MSFQSLNGVLASGGLAGTRRTAPATFALPQQTVAPGQYGPQQAAPVGAAPQAQYSPTTPASRMASSYTLGAGMMNTGRLRPNMGPSDQVTASVDGTRAGAQVPSAVGPQQNPGFDPNDPNNAALAGYMNGGNG